MQIPITTITPTIPTAFFKIEVHPITVSTASPKIFPTTGIKLETAAFAVLAVSPSTLLLKLPSTIYLIAHSPIFLKQFLKQ